MGTPAQVLKEPPPVYAPVVTGGYDYKVPQEQSERVSQFLSSYEVPKRFNRVVVIPDAKWEQAVTDYRLPAGTARVGFALPDAGTAYINANLFKQKHAENGPEWALAHELEHYNDWHNPVEQEQIDRIIDSHARKRLKDWSMRKKDK